MPPLAKAALTSAVSDAPWKVVTGTPAKTAFGVADPWPPHCKFRECEDWRGFWRATAAALARSRLSAPWAECGGVNGAVATGATPGCTGASVNAGPPPDRSTKRTRKS